MKKAIHKIFLSQSLEDGHDAVFEAVTKAALSSDAVVMRVGSTYGSVKLFEHVRQCIYSVDLVVADVTNSKPNVMLEVGLAQAIDKPLILIAANLRLVPAELSGYQMLCYDFSVLSDDFTSRLAKVFSRVFRSPETFSTTRVAEEKSKKRSVFISYSHKDAPFLDRLLVHLKPLERNDRIDLWVDSRLRAGDKWREEIDHALDKSNVAILLVSADYLASDFIIQNELPPLLRKAEERGARIVPLIIKPCRFVRDINLCHFQSFNDPKHPLIFLSDGEQEVVYDSVAAEVERLTGG